MPLPVPPTFIIRIRRPRNGNDLPSDNNSLNTNGAGPRVNIAPHREPSEEELTQINNHVGRITEALNVMIGRFAELYVGQQLMRIGRALGREEFSSNFEQQFSPDAQILEMVRRMSLREYEAQQKRNRASEDAVKNLPIVTIDESHCRKKLLQGGNLAKALKKREESQLEVPTCAICTDLLKIG